MPSRRAAEPIAASLILNIAIRETLSTGDNISRKFGSRSGPTKYFDQNMTVFLTFIIYT